MGLRASVAIILLGPLLAGGCGQRRTEEAKTQALEDVVAGNYAAAEATIDDIYKCLPDGSGAGQEKHGILWCMERGAIAFMDARYAEAESFLRRSGQQAETHRSKHLSRVVASSSVANETVRPYDGEHYENVFAQYLRGLAFLQQAQIADGSVILAGGGNVPALAPVETGSDGVDPLAAYQNATNVMRGATESTLRHVVQNAEGDQAYREDPFVRLICGAVVLANPHRDGTELQGAVAQFQRAVQGYREQRESLRGRRKLRYEVDTLPPALAVLGARACAAYDSEVHERFLAELGPAAEQVRELPEGHGSLLLVNHADFAARRWTLDINLMAISNPSAARIRRRNPDAVIYGGFVFWANGPGWATINETLGGFPVPDGLAKILAPGGLNILGIAIPAHEPDRRAPEPARVVCVAENGSSTERRCVIASDLDAFARATLYENLPRYVVRALARVVAKNLPFVVAAREQAKDGNKGGAFLTNLFGGLTARLSEVADTRCWTTLPARTETALLDLPAGTYTVQVCTPAGTLTPARVEIRPGRLVILPVNSFVEPGVVVDADS
ncbi:MAG: hypothetical protein ACOCZK_05500 [Planctomycetota bacterium]